MDDVVSESELLRASLAGSKEAFGVVVRHKAKREDSPPKNPKSGG
jgi:hypothetical protein